MKAELLKDDGFDSRLAGILDTLDDVESVSMPEGCGWTAWICSGERLIVKRDEDVVVLE